MSERYNPLKLIAVGVALYEVSQFAFTIAARKEIGARDEWTCQGLDGVCTWEESFGAPASFKEGFMVQAAHYPEVHDKTGQGYHDKDVGNGRILCVLDHAIEEIKRGNERGAQQVLRMGTFTINYIRENPEVRQQYFSVDEVKVLIKGK